MSFVQNMVLRVGPIAGDFHHLGSQPGSLAVGVSPLEAGCSQLGSMDVVLAPGVSRLEGVEVSSTVSQRHRAFARRWQAMQQDTNGRRTTRDTRRALGHVRRVLAHAVREVVDGVGERLREGMNRTSRHRI